MNYYTRPVVPIVAAIADDRKRKFLSKTARTQGQSIMFFRDPFKLVPVNDLAEIADKLTRNEIATSNEMRQVIGWKPSDDPKADELRNSNISQAKQDGGTSVGSSSKSNEIENAKQNSTNTGMVELLAMPISTLMSKDNN